MRNSNNRFKRLFQSLEAQYTACLKTTKHKSPVGSTNQDTRVRILDTAEALFADHGFRAVSLRQITREAQVNIAAVNYHFGSRESLVFEVLTRVIGPINEERLRRLTDAEMAHGDNPVPIEEILDALYRPVVSQLEDSDLQSSVFLKLAGRCLAEQQEQFPDTMLKLFQEVAGRFGEAAGRSLPHLNQIDLFWRLHFSVGTLLYALTHSDKLVLFSQGKITSIDPEETLARLIEFTAAGFRSEYSQEKRPQKKSTVLSAFAAAGLFLFSGTACSTGKSPEDAKHFAKLKTPAHWMAGSTYVHDSHPDTFWIDRFRDDNLSGFVKGALIHNRSLKAAQARIEVAMANARITAADLYPQASAGLNGRRTKQNFIGLPIPGADPGGVLTSHSTQFGLSLDVSWELDLWGKIRAAESAAIADFEASRYDRAAAQLSIAGQAAKAWFAMAEAREQVALTERTLATFRETEKSIRERFEAGIQEGVQNSASQLLLAETDVATARDSLVAKKEIIGRTARQLEVLAGKYPAGKAGESARLPSFPKSIPAGLPATLLDRRPDLAAAERRIAAADERLLEAKKMLLPSFSLTTSVGTSSERLGDLLDGDFSVWSLAGNLAQPIFQGGRIKANIKRRESERKMAAADFEQAALTAFSEVENALASEKYLASRIRALTDAARLSRDAFERAREEFIGGTGDLLTMLTAQQRVFAQKSQLLTLRRLRLENRVDLHLALGGSFRVCSAPPEKSVKSDQ